MHNFSVDYDKRLFKNAKSTEECVIRHIIHTEYVNILCMLNGNQIKHKMNKIAIKNHFRSQYTLNFCYKYFIAYVC